MPMRLAVPPTGRMPSRRASSARTALLRALALVLALLAAAPAARAAAPLTRPQQGFLRLASGGVSKSTLWWDKPRHRYRDRLYSTQRYPLATNWSAFRLCETLA